MGIALTAAYAHFTRAGCTALQAASAAFQQESPLVFGEDGQPLADELAHSVNGVWAEAWSSVHIAVASALSLPAPDISVELQRK